MAQYEGFTKYNAAVAGARRIGIYDANGMRVGQIPLGNLELKNTGEKLYSFGVISDTHVSTNSVRIAEAERAIRFFGESEAIEFVCICGDLVDDGKNIEHWENYRSIIEQNANGKPVYAISGNHERIGACKDAVEEYTGQGILRVVKHQNDVFVMLGCRTYHTASEEKPQPTGQYFSVEDLELIDNALNENRNSRCFVFHHVPPEEEYAHPTSKINSSWYLPLKFWEHYKNCTLFHGHSHYGFLKQIEWGNDANYGKTMGFRSVHVPTTMVYEEGYVVDVYQYGLHLRGYDFGTGEYIPYATYWVDTRLVDQPEGLYWKQSDFSKYG